MQGTHRCIHGVCVACGGEGALGNLLRECCSPPSSIDRDCSEPVLQHGGDPGGWPSPTCHCAQNRRTSRARMNAPFSRDHRNAKLRGSPRGTPVSPRWDGGSGGSGTHGSCLRQPTSSLVCGLGRGLCRHSLPLPQKQSVYDDNSATRGGNDPMRSRCKGPGAQDRPVSKFCLCVRSENPNSEPPGHSPSPRQKGPGDCHLQKRGRITKEVQKRPGEINQESEPSPEEPQRKDVPRKRFISSSKHNQSVFLLGHIHLPEPRKSFPVIVLTP